MIRVKTSKNLVILSEQGVEGPHVDEMKELGEQLDGEGRVDPTFPARFHQLHFMNFRDLCSSTPTNDVCTFLRKNIKTIPSVSLK